MNILRRLIVPTFISSTIVLTGCVMMFLPAMSKMHGTFDQTDEEKLITGMDDLVGESIEALESDFKTHHQIFMEKIEVAGNIIPPEKLRAAIKESLHKKGLVVIDHLGKGNLEPEKHKTASSDEEKVAILIAHLYKIDNELWLALQLLDVNSRNILWTSLHSKSVTSPNKLQSFY